MTEETSRVVEDNVPLIWVYEKIGFRRTANTLLEFIGRNTNLPA